jgi:tRNA1Val (adenine37-N6)-methyltransferase
MGNPYFQFKQFTIQQDRCAMKVTTDACLFGTWVAKKVVASSLAMTSWNLEVGSILDIGTGTGLLSLMLAQEIHVSIDGIEIDEAAAKQASENVAASPWKERVNIIHGNIKDHAVLPLDRYDVIVSNPPFYENELASPHAKKNMAHHDEGLLLPELLQVISKTLAPGGLFYLLLPYKRMEEAKLLLQKNHLAITHTTMVRQSTQHGYFRLFIAGGHEGKTSNHLQDEIAIKNEKNEYTAEFIELLKDYYLHL